MNIKIIKIVDPGNLTSERIIFKAEADSLIGSYLVLKTKTLSGRGVSSSTSGTYWFPDKSVKNGELIVLYTKIGKNTEVLNKDGSTTHFFYWNRSLPVWMTPDDTVVLAYISSWGSLQLADST